MAVVTSPRVRSSTARSASVERRRPAGERVGVVDGDEHPVDVVHEREQPLGLRALVAPEAVEHLSPQLARGLRHPVEVGLHVDTELAGGGQRVAPRRTPA